MIDLPDSGSNRALTPFRGRLRELEAALAVATSALRDRSSAVLQILGVRGRGKSRLVDELLMELAELGGPTPLVLRAGSSSSSEIEPLAQVLRERFLIEDTMDDDLARWLVRGEMKEMLDDSSVEDFATVLVRLMNIPVSTPLLDAVDPTESRRTLDRGVLAAFLERDARSRPVVLVLEDLHNWPETSELVRLVAGDLRGRVLVVLTSQVDVFAEHELEPPSALTTIELGPLSTEECELMIRDRLFIDDDALPEHLVEACRAFAGGSPGLVDEALTALESEGVFRRTNHAGGHPTFEVDLGRLPAATALLDVNEAVEVRVAALDPTELRILQHAASLGAIVWSGGVAAQELAVGPEGDRLSAAGVQLLLDRLAGRDFLLRMPESSFEHESEYVFKHTIERAVIGRGVPLRERHRRHRVIADWIEARPETATNPDHLITLGEHLEASALYDRSAESFFAAAATARRDRSLRVVSELYRRGLALLGDGRSRRRVDALHDYGVALVGLGSTRDALTVFHEMLELAEVVGLPSKMAAAQSRIGRVHRERGELGVAREWLDCALDLFTQANDWRGVAAAHDDLGRLDWMAGDYDGAQQHVVTALELRSSHKDPGGLALSLDNLALVSMERGRHATAMEALELAMGIRHDRGDRVGVVQCLHDLGRLAQHQNDHVRAIDTLFDAIDMACDTNGYPYMARLLGDLAESHLHLGEIDEAMRAAGHAEQLALASMDRFDLAAILRVQAKVYLERGELADARHKVESCVSICNEVDSAVLLASVLRTMGEVASATADDQDTERDAAECFVRSANVGKQAGNDREVAKTYRAFARCARRFPHIDQRMAVQREAVRLERIADEMFERAKIRFDDDEWFTLRLTAISTPAPTMN